MDLSFLKANRFWVMVIGCLTIAANDNFTKEGWLKAIGAFVAGFVAVRTIDRASETLVK